MDTLTFIVEMSKALAWPIAAITLGSVYRTEFRSLLTKLKKGKVGPAEFEFEQAVAALKQESPKANSDTNTSVPQATVQLASNDPRVAILGSWLPIQAEVERLVSEAPSEWTQGQRGSVSLRVLHRVLKDKPEYIDMYNNLRQLRNQAVHDTNFSPRPESVLDYIALSKDLLSVLQSTKTEPEHFIQTEHPH